MTCPSWPTPSKRPAAPILTSWSICAGRGRTSAAAGCDSLTINVVSRSLATVVVAVRRSLADNSQTVLMQFQPKEVAF